MEERNYWLGFSVFPGIGPARFTTLLSQFGTAKEAWNAPETNLKAVLGPMIATKFTDFRKTFPFAKYLQDLHDKKVTALLLADENYPKLLAGIKNPPFVLYVKGTYTFNNSLTTLAVVGTRRISSYGMQVTRSLVPDLVQAGCVVISGLAMGVDGVAHKATIDEGGKTIAVLGCGVDCCTPAVNYPIYEKIIQSGGAIVSEFPLGSSPTKGSFPSRNRIIAGLSEGVIVTEGAQDSGALITAKDAFANRRKVFAVPGPITSDLSKGPYELIRNGAVLVTTAAEILEKMNIKAQIQKDRNKIKADTKEEQIIIDLLIDEPLHFDIVLKRTKMTSSSLASLLSLLEMKGLVQSLENGFFSVNTT